MDSLISSSLRKNLGHIFIEYWDDRLGYQINMMNIWLAVDGNHRQGIAKFAFSGAKDDRIFHFGSMLFIIASANRCMIFPSNGQEYFRRFAEGHLD
jgi:hypothetical protein